MNSVKRYFLPLLFAWPVICAAQQYPVFTQYYFNELVINPAYAGSHVQLSLTATYRNQWVNFPGAPRTYSISGHSSFYDAKVGVGLLVNHDEIGSYQNDNVYTSYAYRLHFRDATLSMGLQGGFNIIGANFSKLDLQNPGDAAFSALKELKPNVGAGVFYNKENFFVGFSVPFLINNAAETSFENIVQEIREARYYFLRSGAILPLNRTETVKLNPSILIRGQEGQAFSLDVNMGVIIHDVLSTGFSWRSGDALISFIDLKLSEQFHFAYSFDLTSSPIRKFSNGSHEFTLNFRTRIKKLHGTLECPTYYRYR